MKRSVIYIILIFSISFVITAYSQSNIKSKPFLKNNQDQLGIKDVRINVLSDSNHTESTEFKIENQSPLNMNSMPFSMEDEEKILRQKRTQFKERFDHILKELNEFIEKNKSEEL